MVTRKIDEVKVVDVVLHGVDKILCDWLLRRIRHKRSVMCGKLDPNLAW